jgi:hypothetical protein
LIPIVNKEIIMPYVANGNFTETTAVIGNGQCVALVKELTGAPASSMWREGESLIALFEAKKMIPRGTAIATFVDGCYQNRATGNHAAIFIRQVAGGIEVFDQWTNHPPSKRTIMFGHAASRGAAQRPELYSMIR